MYLVLYKSVETKSNKRGLKTECEPDKNLVKPCVKWSWRACCTDYWQDRQLPIIEMNDVWMVAVLNSFAVWILYKQNESIIIHNQLQLISDFYNFRPCHISYTCREYDKQSTVAPSKIFYYQLDYLCTEYELYIYTHIQNIHVHNYM